MCFSGSCWATARSFLERTDAHIVLVQETKLDGESKAEAEQWCLNHKWQGFISPCLRSEAGLPTAGTGVFVRSHIGAAPLAGFGAMTQPGSICDGWAMAVHCNFGMKGGLIVASVYLECGVGLGFDTKNWHRCLRIAETMNHYGRPFVLGVGTGIIVQLASVRADGRQPCKHACRQSATISLALADQLRATEAASTTS